VIAAARRTTELGLIVLAAIIIVASYALASLGRSASLPANVVPFLGVILGLLVAAHVATRVLAPAADGILLPIALLLNGIGYVFIARLDEDKAAQQAGWTALGVAAFIATLIVVRRVRDLERWRYSFAFAGLGLLLMPLLPLVGHTVGGARLWVRLGPASFQPGEFAKIALAIFFAAYLVEKRELLEHGTVRILGQWFPDPKHLGPVMTAWGFSLVVMVFERDLGSSLLFFALFVSMVWMATGRGTYLVIGGLLFAAGSVAGWMAFSHVQARVEIWLDPWPVADGRGYQVVQSMFAFGTGGVAGTGIALGSPGRIPAATTDFIFAAIGEELGLMGSTAIVAAFLLMIGAGLRIALAASNDFEKLLAAGLTTILGVQTFIILGGVTRLVPLTGITLPFVSYGGSSLLANYILLAVLLRISDNRSRGGGDDAPAGTLPTTPADATVASPSR